MTSLQRKSSRIIALLALTCLMVTGCTKNHETWVNTANDRWLELRSSLKLEVAEQRFNTGDLDQAENTLKEARGYDPNNPKLLTLAGRIALERSQLERAYHLFELAIEQDVPKELKELKAKEDVDRDSEQYKQEYKQAMEGYELKLDEPRYYQAIVFQRWQNYEAAHDRYNEAYEIKPDNASYLLAKCEMLVELDRNGEAIEVLESKLTYFDQNAGVRAALAHLYGIEGRHELAATYFQEASMLDPENVKMREELAASQFYAGQYQNAAQTVKQLIDDPTIEVRPDLLRLRAKALAEAEMPDEAREAYLDLTRSDGAEAADWICLGELAWKAGDMGGAMTAANRAITLEPRRHEGYLLAGMVWQKRDRLDDALRSFDRAAELAPEDAVPLILRGIALQRVDRPSAAAQAYAEALRRQPDDPRAKQLLDGLAAAQNSQLATPIP